MSNIEQSKRQDRAIAAINPGLSVARPFLHQPNRFVRRRRFQPSRDLIDANSATRTSALIGSTMTHYIAIMAPSDAGGWRVWIPDVPECESHGNSPDAAKVAAVIEMTRVRANIGALPLPRELIDIATDKKWMSRGDIDFTKAVVAMIPLGNTDPAE
jgi:hypothetical protein